MANRAYLWSADLPSLTEEEKWWHGEPYYDSRWNIPLAWFFLFHPHDLRMIEITWEGSTWKEPRLAAVRQDAIATFQHRKSLLSRVVSEDPQRTAIIDGFVQTLSAWSGSHLLLNPSEVSDDYEEDNYSRLRDLLEEISTSTPQQEQLPKLLSRYNSTQYEDALHFVRDVIGYTYAVSTGA